MRHVELLQAPELHTVGLLYFRHDDSWRTLVVHVTQTLSSYLEGRINHTLLPSSTNLAQRGVLREEKVQLIMYMLRQTPSAVIAA